MTDNKPMEVLKKQLMNYLIERKCAKNNQDNYRYALNGIAIVTTMGIIPTKLLRNMLRKNMIFMIIIHFTVVIIIIFPRFAEFVKS